ncbi:LysR family transcriptional regulator [Proteus hauseri]|uniref:LysR family transcriptional regulator n=1 Tax=Proteus hauseri TaxID=183417 RepID=UPI0010097B5F|nr:LysR family transcriptional regulator [Proteus hauseri]QAV23323.1 LysR family transcriptional regulator [Proteus hauseri]
MEKSRTTLDQWITLQAVVDYGGFAQAAEILHRTQSSVSYTINKLEQILEIEILSLEKRRAVLTHEGELLLELSREITEKAISLEKRAKKIKQNNKLKINLLIDPLYTSDYLLNKISIFIRDNRHYDVNINKVSLNKSDIFSQKENDIIITHHYIKSLQPIVLERIKTVLVTHPEHPLQQYVGDEISQQLQKHTFISLLPDTSENSNSIQNVSVGSVETALNLIQHSIGYSRLPLSLIQDELNKKTIKQLNMQQEEKEYKFYLYMNKNSFPTEDIKILLSTIGNKNA